MLLENLSNSNVADSDWKTLMASWKRSNLDFSEIDTSGLPPDLNLGELPSFDLRDIIDDGQALNNTDYINNNFEQKQLANQEVTTSAVEKKQGKNRGAQYLQLKPSTRLGGKPVSSFFRKFKPEDYFTCIVCKSRFLEKSVMKEHVKSRHFRQIVLCVVCGKNVYKDRLRRHCRTCS